jgi:hypothetical protein
MSPRLKFLKNTENHRDIRATDQGLTVPEGGYEITGVMIN